MTINWLHWISSSFVCWTKVWDKSTNHSDVWRPCSLYLRLYHPSRSTGLHFPDGLVWLLEGTSPNLMLSKCLEPPSLGAFPIPINSPSIYHFFHSLTIPKCPICLRFLELISAPGPRAWHDTLLLGFGHLASYPTPQATRGYMAGRHRATCEAAAKLVSGSSGVSCQISETLDFYGFCTK